MYNQHPLKSKTLASTARQRPGRQDDRQRPASPPRTDLQTLVAKRAHELYIERGYRHGYALEDWLEAEREILTQMPPV